MFQVVSMQDAGTLVWNLCLAFVSHLCLFVRCAECAEPESLRLSGTVVSHLSPISDLYPICFPCVSSLPSPNRLGEGGGGVGLNLFKQGLCDVATLPPSNPGVPSPRVS